MDAISPKQWAFPDNCTHWRGGDPSQYQVAQYRAALARCSKRDVAIDIGAHVGLFSRRMADDFQTVYAFEPEPSNFRCLAANTPNNVRLMNCALAACRTVATMTNPAPHNSGAWEMAQTGEDVPVFALDAFELRPDLIKVDVQGSELAVLNGAKDTIREYRPVILIETVLAGVRSTKIVERLEGMNYGMTDRIGKDEVWTAHD